VSPAARDSTDPRRRAVAALARVDESGAFAARLLGHATPLERELVLGTLRWQLTVDARLAPHLRRPLASLDPLVRACLRVGAYEAARLSTPMPVAVAEAVRVARELAPRAAGLVNAVLRRAAAAAWPAPDDETIPLSVRTSHPPWLVERWRGRFGGERLNDLLWADQEPAPLWLLAAASDLAALRADGAELEPHPLVAGVVAVRRGAETAVALLRAGRAYAIDPAAVAVARLLPETPGPVADLAAAPGGKSLVLAGERPGVRHLAADRHVGRCAMLRGTLRRHAPAALVAAADGAAPCLRPRSLAAVLLDAPCSGTGTLRRHPEIRWRLQPEALAPLAAVQRDLVRQAAGLVAPGGFLLYATCSLEAEENEAVIAGLDLDAVPAAAWLPGNLPAVALPSGGAVLPPGAVGDGFTVHLLRRPA